METLPAGTYGGTYAGTYAGTTYAGTSYAGTYAGVQLAIRSGGKRRGPVVEDCSRKCDKIEGCNSFARRSDGFGCWYKDKCITSTDLVVTHYVTYYKPCCDDKQDKPCPLVQGYSSLSGVAKEEGEDVFTDNDMGDYSSVADCSSLCDIFEKCNSFARSSDGKGCWFKDKCIKSTDSFLPHYVTFYKPCRQG
eukprot:CAMPEP_0168485656 /NCGR_PEP_ID=MMETSP0228-20121227/66720_1 /TAXON_ID=133427 /ORGANISM="Protoceratium reticulatum, Strain CCCM 535 (=CCMP 1889)" /LENGTH=191 /DNA_ID=CAMNT_0008502223 /DNA_START=682 /DNA_END=1257 /DNA_ORIENTATION=-